MNKVRPKEESLHPANPSRSGPPEGRAGPHPMERGPQNIQDNFLNQLRRERTLVAIFLVSGVKLSGRIKSFDRYSLVLESDGQEQLIFKHAIASIVAGKASPTADPTAGQHSGAHSRGESGSQP